MCTLQERENVIKWIHDIFEKDGFSDFKVEFPTYDTTGGSSATMIPVSLKARKNNEQESFEILIKKNKTNDILLDKFDLEYVYDTEINLYTKVLPYFSKFAKVRNVHPFNSISHCFGAISYEHNHVLFLENLKPKGFRLNQSDKLMDFDQAKLILEAYGSWHALSLACKDQEPEKFSYFEQLMSPWKSRSICELFVCSMLKEIEAAIDFFRDRNCSKIAERLEVYKGKYPKLYRDGFFNKDEECLVVRHVDCWNNNFLFLYRDGESSPDKAVIVDWQLSSVGSPLADVTQFLFYSCHKETLQQTDDLLLYYYRCLSDKLSELGSDPSQCFSWKACQESFEKYVPWAVGGVPLNIRFRHKTAVDEETVKQHLDDGSFNVLGGNEIRDPEEYFETLKGILELCVERNYI